jgi:hypothetical protein
MRCQCRLNIEQFLCQGRHVRMHHEHAWLSAAVSVFAALHLGSEACKCGS